MVVVRPVPILEPFLQLTVLPDLHRGQLAAHRTQSVTKQRIFIQHRSRTACIRKQVENQLIVHRDSSKQVRFLLNPAGSVFRRIRRSYNQIACIGVTHQEIDKELRRAFHNRIYFFQVLFVTRIQITVPQVLAQPGITNRPRAAIRIIYGTGHTPQISIMMKHPSTATIHFACRFFSVFTQFTYHLNQRFMQFRQVRNLGGPIIHLRIDIGGIIAIPCRFGLCIPFSLQVSRLATGLRTGYQQIAPILEIQRNQMRIV